MLLSPFHKQQLTGTKEDLPNLSSEKYDDMMNGNPDDIMQARIPDENPFAKVRVLLCIHLVFTCIDKANTKGKQASAKQGLLTHSTAKNGQYILSYQTNKNVDFFFFLRAPAGQETYFFW